MTSPEDGEESLIMAGKIQIALRTEGASQRAMQSECCWRSLSLPGCNLAMEIQLLQTFHQESQLESANPHRDHLDYQGRNDSTYGLTADPYNQTQSSINIPSL